MTISKCDGCGKEMARDEEGRVWAGTGAAPFGACEFCASCGKPVQLFLQRMTRQAAGAKKAVHDKRAGFRKA